MILNENVEKKIIPIAGGKGGVGKSVIAVNLALGLAMNGKKTVLVDLDIGGSNIHTLLGEKNVRLGIGNLVAGLSSRVTELIRPTKWENLSYIPGDALVCGIGELTKSVKAKITAGLLEIEADYIILDLGGGTNFTVLDFFLISNSGLIIMTPQTTSVINAYSFLRNLLFRFLQRVFAENKSISSYLRRTFKERKIEDRKTIAEIIQEISSKDELIAEKANNFIKVLKPRLILNKVSGPSDIVMAEGLRDLCKKTLSVNIECLGTLLNSEIVGQSIDSLTPFVAESPEQMVTSEIHRIAQKILQSKQYPELPLELDYYADSYELAQIETENDLITLQEGEKSSKDAHNFDVNQLIELVQMQQSKIKELQGTLRMLSMGQ